MALLVTQDEAREAARCCLPTLLRAHPEPPLEQWDVARFEGLSFEEILSGDALEIADIQGRPLFRDFSSILQGGRELRVRTAADRRLGDPVISVEISERPWPVARALEKARAALKAEHPGGEEPLLVCYSYPRLGLWLRPSLIADLAGGPLLRVGPGNPEEKLVWSPLDRVQDPEACSAEWANVCESLGGLQWEKYPSLVDRVEAVAPLQIPRVFPLHLEPQDDNARCAPATAKMILEFHGIPVTEDRAAEVMRTVSVGSPANQGTSPENEVRGYQELTAQTFSVIRDGYPTFEKAKAEIDGEPGRRGAPFRSGVVNGLIHARAVAGYLEGPGTRRLYVYDPLHPLYLYQGARRWESWADHFHTDFVYVRPPA